MTTVWGTPAQHQIDREMRAVEWACEHGESYLVECLDPPISWTYHLDGKRIRRSLLVNWRAIPSWLGDRFRELACDLRIWNNRRRGLVNPHRSGK
jgi:hypothetical protein